MRFYYTSTFSIMFLGLIYLIGTLALIWWGRSLRKEGRNVWLIIPPLLLLFYVLPIAEELQTAWTFGRLCKKDAGIFVYKTVEVDGFYDDTHTWTERRMNDPLEPHFRFVEGRGQRDGKTVYWRHERVGNVVRSSEIDHPTARYSYRWPHTNSPMGHKVDKIEEVVFDSQTNEVLARETRYRRRAPWFFIGLDAPVMLCPAPGENPLQKYGAAYNLALKPIGN